MMPLFEVIILQYNQEDFDAKVCMIVIKLERNASYLNAKTCIVASQRQASLLSVGTGTPSLLPEAHYFLDI